MRMVNRDQRTIFGTAIALVVLASGIGMALRDGGSPSATAAPTSTIAQHSANAEGPVAQKVDDATTTSTSPPVTTASTGDLSDPVRKNRAAQMLSSFQFSSTAIQYNYAESTRGSCGMSAGRDGACSGRGGELLALVNEYTSRVPNNGLAQYLPALRKVSGTPSIDGLSGFEAAFRAEDAGSNQAAFRQTQDEFGTRVYFNPAMAIAKQYNVTSALGQAMIWDTIMYTGVNDAQSTAAETASRMGDAVRGNEPTWLSAFLDMRTSHQSNDQEPLIALRSILQSGNLSMNAPMSWTAYGTHFSVTS